MTFGELKDLAAAIQSFAIATAALVGGAWALFRFFSLRTVEQARTELERVRRALQERGIIDIELQAAQMQWEQCYAIAVRVKLTNRGTGTEVIDWSSSFLRAAKAMPSARPDAGCDFDENWILGQRPMGFSDTSLAPGECREHSFLVPVPEVGIYYLLFYALCSPPATELEREARDKAGVRQPHELSWSSDLFFNVKESAA